MKSVAVDHPDPLWHKVMDVNANGPYRMTKPALRGMIERRWGRIINISSTAGNVAPRCLPPIAHRKPRSSGLRARWPSTVRMSRIRLGDAFADPPHPKGFYFEPALITDVKNEIEIAKEEIFGPVITVERFHSEEQAVEWANDTIYGLSAGLWTRDQDRAERVAARLRAGTVWINDFNTYFVQAPWGGYKQSGLGRELGKIGLEEYTEVKHIYQNHANAPINWFGATS